RDRAGRARRRRAPAGRSVRVVSAPRARARAARRPRDAPRARTPPAGRRPRARRAPRTATGTSSVPGARNAGARAVAPRLAEAGALAGADARAVGGGEPQQELEVELREVVRRIGAHGVREVGHRFVDLALAGAGREAAEAEDAEERERLRAPARGSAAGDVRQLVLGVGPSGLPLERVVEAVRHRRGDAIGLQRPPDRKVVARSEQVAREPSEPRRRLPARTRRCHGVDGVAAPERSGPRADVGGEQRDEHCERGEAAGGPESQRAHVSPQSSRGAQSAPAASTAASASASATSSHGNGVRSCGGAWLSVGASATTGAACVSLWKSATSFGSGFRPTMRTGAWSRRNASITVASRVRSLGLSSRSLTSTTVACLPPDAAIRCASSIPAEMRVPPLNPETPHGFGGNAGANPGRRCGGSVKYRTNGARSAEGVPGGSASYAWSEKTTRPKRRPLRESAASVPPMREYVSDEMLAEWSSTSTVSACAGNGTIVCVCGCRDSSRKAMPSATAAAAAVS